ncbi:MAG: DUF3667 domain-containing protein [Bacteroidota bacterium]
MVQFKEFVLDFLGDYFTFDSLIFRSVKPLIFMPGFLTLEFISGRRVSYIPPLRLFIFISILFFIVLGPVDTVLDQENIQEAAFLDSFFTTWFPRLFFLLLPLFALFLLLLFRKRGQYYLKHFIFSVHYHAFAFLLLTVMVVLIDYIFPSSVFLSRWALVISLILLEVYLVIALRRVYQQKWILIALKLFVLNLLYVGSSILVFSFVGAAIFYL